MLSARICHCCMRCCPQTLIRTLTLNALVSTSVRPSFSAGNSSILIHPQAQIQYYLALGAHQFAGNSVALADALLIMERWNAGRYATYYNSGNIPLEAHIPLFP